jgi:hypothetical protein
LRGRYGYRARPEVSLSKQIRREGRSTKIRGQGRETLWLR